MKSATEPLFLITTNYKMRVLRDYPISTVFLRTPNFEFHVMPFMIKITKNCKELVNRSKLDLIKVIKFSPIKMPGFAL